MALPADLKGSVDWTIVGPLGPRVPEFLLSYSRLGVDGGADFCDELDLWVGDSDSCAELPACRHLVRHSPEKDLSDLALALALFTEDAAYRFHLWGFLGGRRDHELFNLGEVHRFLKGKARAEVSIYDGRGELRFRFFGSGRRTFTHRGTFSLGTLEATPVTLEGQCRYHIPEGTVLSPLSSFGLSNAASGTFEVRCQGPCFIYFTETK